MKQNEDTEERCIFVGNIGTASAIHIAEFFNAFNIYLSKIDIKAGYAFAYCDNSPDLAESIEELSRIPFSKDRRFLKVEFSKGSSKRDEEYRRQQTQPTETVFVFGFDPRCTTPEDLREEFSRFGRITRVDMKKNFAFVQFTSVTEAAAATSADGIIFLNRRISVQFVADKGKSIRSNFDSGAGRDNSNNTYGPGRGRQSGRDSHDSGAVRGGREYSGYYGDGAPRRDDRDEALGTSRGGGRGNYRDNDDNFDRGREVKSVRNRSRDRTRSRSRDRSRDRRPDDRSFSSQRAEPPYRSRSFDREYADRRSAPRRSEYEGSSRDRCDDPRRFDDRDYYPSSSSSDRRGDYYVERDAGRKNDYLLQDRSRSHLIEAQRRYSGVSEMGVFVMPKPTSNNSSTSNGRSTSGGFGEAQNHGQERGFGREEEQTQSLPHEGGHVEAKETDFGDDRSAYNEGGYEGDNTYYKRGPHTESPVVENDNAGQY